MKTVATPYINGSGARIMRTLLRAVDRFGKVVWLDSDRWADGRRTMLLAYNADGSQRWERGYAWRRAAVYHRENIVSVEGC